MIKFISTQLNGSNNIVEVLDFVSNLQEIYFDFETTGLNPHVDKPILLAVGNADMQYVIDLRSTDTKYIKKLFANNKDKLWIAHNAKFEYKFTKIHYNVELRNLYCTMIASQVIWNGWDISHSLKECMLRHFGIKLNKDERKSFEGMDDRKAFSDSQILYVAEDIAFLPRLKARQLEVCPDVELRNYLFEIEFPLIACLGRSELLGVKLDVDKWNAQYIINLKKLKETVANFKQYLTNFKSEISTPFTKDKKKSKERVKRAYQPAINWDNTNEPIKAKTPEELILDDLNVNSAIQVKVLLKRLNINLQSTRVEFLQEWVLENPDSKHLEFVKRLFEIRKLSKLCSTYGKKFLDFINPVTKRVHTNWNQCKTDTLRISSDEPNLQQIPRSNLLRNCFEAEDGYSFAIIDYSQQELLIAASITKDPTLMEIAIKGLDVHSYFAIGSYNIIYKALGRIPNHGDFKSEYLEVEPDGTIIVSKDKNPKLRTEHKRLTFAKVYLAGPNRFKKVLNIPKEVAYKVFNKIESLLPVLTKFQHSILSKVKKTLTVFGNDIYKVRKYFHKVKLGKMEEYEMEKSACNHPIQHTGASQKKESWVNIDKFFYHNGYYEKYPDIGVVLDIHDRQNCCV